MNTKLMNPQALNFESDNDAPPVGDFPAQMKGMVQLLHRLKHGALRIEFPNGRSMSFGDGSMPVAMTLHNWNVAAAVLKSGDIGFAESFINGDWHTDDLPRLVELLVRNREAAESLIYGTWWGNLVYRIRHLFNRNTRSGSRKNIHAHYDIGNDFYRLWLDPSMTYSSALFRDGQSDGLEQAQQAKYRRIVDELHLAPGARVLEIGCGWGGFAELAATEASAHVTGLTLSPQQLGFAQQRLAAAGMSHRADLRLQDYRDVEGSFDAVASIEMFEAVGEEYWPGYFDCIARALKPGGRACIQSIVIADELFARYRKGTDFIQQYIFPGGMLPSPSAFRTHAERHGLKVMTEFRFGQDYARTLAHWRSAFHATSADIRSQGFDELFMRTWDFYLAYCEAGFRAGSIDVAQFTLIKT